MTVMQPTTSTVEVTSCCKRGAPKVRNDLNTSSAMTQPEKAEPMVEHTGALTGLDLDVLRYAERNHGRNFVTALAGEPHNIAIHRLTAAGLFCDGGPSASGRWSALTEAGRAALTKAQGGQP